MWGMEKHTSNISPTNAEFRVLDLFCGAGGFSWGFEQNNNFKTLLGVDYDKKALETFHINHPNSDIVYGDLLDKSIKNKIIKKAQLLKINFIIGGPPCQGFSLKGKKQGLNDPRNFLFQEFVYFVEKIKPKVFVLENVKTMITAANGYFIKRQ